MSNMPEYLKSVESYFVQEPSPLLTWETIQIVLFREVLDYAVFRTEESGELNTTVTPDSIDSSDVVERVAFLASKQKAVESREFQALLRTAAREVDFDIEECYLKDHLCLKCPRCALFGGTQVSATSDDHKGNIKHRISYATAFSLAPYQEVEEAITFNAVNEDTVETDQALGSRNTVRPATIFPSIITLRSATWKEFVLTLKTVLQSRKYGAETRIGGDVRNTVVALNFGWEEALTPLELCLELSSWDPEMLGDAERIADKIQEYGSLGAVPEKQTVLAGQHLNEVIEGVRQTGIDEDFLEVAYEDVRSFRKIQGNDE